jgi:hypothetical protein
VACEIGIVASMPSLKVRIGGDAHEGWLQSSAIEPQPLALRAVDLRIEVQFDGSGYLLSYESVDGALSGDTWHATLEEAKRSAKEEFGVKAHDWLRA